MKLGRMDHYTLIVEDSEQASKFLTDVLGFKFLRIIDLNTGTVPEDEVDMRNYVLQTPADEDCVVVVTEGLNEETIFCKYLKKFGSGVHHIGYRVENIDSAVEDLKKNFGVQFTSEKITLDPLTGLRQIFIAKEHAGYFIELIERPKDMVYGTFIDKNMKQLAETMKPYVQE